MLIAVADSTITAIDAINAASAAIDAASTADAVVDAVAAVAAVTAARLILLFLACFDDGSFLIKRPITKQQL